MYVYIYIYVETVLWSAESGADTIDNLGDH